MTSIKMLFKPVNLCRKYIVGLLLFAVDPLSLSAQSVADLWITMPEEFVPYLTLNQKKEMIECHRIGVDSSVKNKLEGTTSIDTLSNSYGKFLVSNSRSLQLVKLPAEKDSILMLIDTHLGPKKYSEAKFYTMNWEKLPDAARIPVLEFSDFVCRPDTLSSADYEFLISSVAPVFYGFEYDKTAETLIVSPEIAFLTLEEKKRLETLLSKQTLIWGNNMFIKVIK